MAIADNQTAPPGGGEFLSEAEILTRLPICRRTLATWKAKGFPHIKIGRRCLYSWSNCQQFLLRQERGGQQ
jgi:hypothetical protein